MVPSFAAHLRAFSLSSFAMVMFIALLASFSLSAARADDFRIATKIYVGEEVKEGKKEPTPVSETTTLFLGGVVYDFLADGSQTAVFRKLPDQDGRFILLNSDHRIRTELSTAQVFGAMAKLRTWAAKQSDPMLKFAADPKFEESFEPEGGRLILASHLETYTVTTRPVEYAEAMAEYREFLHWYTQLNTLLHAGPPPEPRLRLNEALARRRVVPEKVELTRAGDKEPLRAVHEFTMRLSRDDMERIDQVRTSLAGYREVTNEEYLRASQPESALK
jgi:hypothetical protein